MGGGELKHQGLEAARPHRIHTREAQTSACCCSASLSPLVLPRIPAREWCHPEWTSLSIHLYKHNQDTPPRHAQRPVSFPPHWGHHSTQPKYIVTIGVLNKLIFPSSCVKKPRCSFCCCCFYCLFCFCFGHRTLNPSHCPSIHQAGPVWLSHICFLKGCSRSILSSLGQEENFSSHRRVKHSSIKCRSPPKGRLGYALRTP